MGPAVQGLCDPTPGGLLQIDPKRLRLDDPFPTDIPVPPNGMPTFAAATLQTAKGGNHTVREVLRKLGSGTGHRTFVGTPEALADDMERWLNAGAADGFNLMPDVFPRWTGNPCQRSGADPAPQKKSSAVSIPGRPYGIISASAAQVKRVWLWRWRGTTEEAPKPGLAAIVDLVRLA